METQIHASDTSESTYQPEPLDPSPWLKSLLESWIEPFNLHVKALLEVLTSFTEACATGDGDSREKGLERVIRDYDQWAQELPEVFSKVLEAPCWNSARESFQKWENRLPALAQVEVPHAELLPKQSDSRKLGFWKKRQRLYMTVRRMTLFSTGWIWRIAGRKPPTPSPVLRVFPMRSFSAFYLEQPQSQWLLEEKIRLLVMTAEQVNLLQEFLKEARGACGRNSGTNGIGGRAQRNWQDLAEISRGHLEKIKAVSQQLEDFVSQGSARAEEKRQALAREWDAAWILAGTDALHAHVYGRINLARKWKKLRARHAEMKSGWKNYWEDERDDWLKDKDLTRLQVETVREMANVMESTESLFEVTLGPALEDLENLLRAWREERREEWREKVSFDAAHMRTMHDDILDRLRQGQLPAALSAMEKVQRDLPFESLPKTLRALLDGFPASHRIYRNRTFESGLPSSRSEKIALRDILWEEAGIELSQSIHDLRAKAEVALANAKRQLQLTHRIVDFNMGAAEDVLSEEPGSAQALDVALEGIARVEEQIKTQRIACLELCADIRKRWNDLTGTWSTRLDGLANNERIYALKLRYAQARARARFRVAVETVWSELQRLYPSLKRRFAQAAGKGDSLYLRFRQLSGLEPQPARVEERLGHFLAETQRRISSLPPVYQALFRIAPLEDSNFWVARDEEHALLGVQISKWQSGQYSPTAIIGEKGAGTTSFVRMFMQSQPSGIECIFTRFEQTLFHEKDLLEFLRNLFATGHSSTLEELEEWIVAGESRGQSRRMCVVEGLQNLYLRMPDGFEVMERFLIFMARTQRQVFWLATCTSFGWTLLDKVVAVSRSFSKVIPLQRHSREKMQEIIFLRHQLSGYSLYFEASRAVKKNKGFRSLTGDVEKQNYLKELYFDKLDEFAAGNIKVALLFWLMSIGRFESGRIHVRLETDMDFSFLNTLPMPDLLTLAACLQHDSLDAREHALLFQQPAHRSAGQLQRLLDLSVLIRNGNDYEVHPFLYRPIARALKTRNLLQER